MQAFYMLIWSSSLHFAMSLQFKEMGVMTNAALSESAMLQLRIANRWAPWTSPSDKGTGLMSILGKPLPYNISYLLPSREKEDHVALRRRIAATIHEADTSSVVNSRRMVQSIKAYASRYGHEIKSKTAIFFSHISKSAGTTFCICGQSNGCVGSGMAEGKDPVLENCHAGENDPHAPDDLPHWAAKMQHPHEYDTCAGLQKYAIENRFTLEGNENWLIGDGLCPQFWNVIILRDPIDRLVSHLQELSRIPANTASSEVQTGPLAWNASKLTPEYVFQQVPILSDNFYTRSLLGAETYSLPLGALNQTHLERAKKVLEGFDLVLLLHPDLFENLHDFLGWSCSASRRVAPDDFATALHSHWGEVEWKKVKARNALDIELAKHAASLFKLDQLVLNHEAFVVNNECGDAECGFLCKSSPLAAYINKTIHEKR